MLLDKLKTDLAEASEGNPNFVQQHITFSPTPATSPSDVVFSEYKEEGTAIKPKKPLKSGEIIIGGDSDSSNKTKIEASSTAEDMDSESLSFLSTLAGYAKTSPKESMEGIKKMEADFNGFKQEIIDALREIYKGNNIDFDADYAKYGVSQEDTSGPELIEDDEIEEVPSDNDAPVVEIPEGDGTSGQNDVGDVFGDVGEDDGEAMFKLADSEEVALERFILENTSLLSQKGVPLELSSLLDTYNKSNMKDVETFLAYYKQYLKC